VADILITVSFLADSDQLINLISEVGYRLVQRTNKIPPQTTTIFQFTQPTASLRRMQHTRAHNKHRFASGGIDEEQELQDLCIERMRKHLFPYLEEAVKHEKAPNHMRSHSSLDVASSTFNVSVTSPRHSGADNRFQTTVLTKSGTYKYKEKSISYCVSLRGGIAMYIATALEALTSSRPSVLTNLDVPSHASDNAALSFFTAPLQHRTKPKLSQIPVNEEKKNDDENDDDAHLEIKETEEEHSYASVLSEHSTSIHILGKSTYGKKKLNTNQKKSAADDETDDSMKHVQRSKYIESLEHAAQKVTKETAPKKKLGVQVTNREADEYSGTHDQAVQSAAAIDQGQETEPESSFGENLPPGSPFLLSMGTVEMK
ncbi:hypothetical protein RFI_17868, partial [Reticulomyxa filosa]